MRLYLFIRQSDPFGDMFISLHADQLGPVQVFADFPQPRIGFILENNARRLLETEFLQRPLGGGGRRLLGEELIQIRVRGARFADWLGVHALTPLRR